MKKYLPSLAILATLVGNSAFAAPSTSAVAPSMNLGLCQGIGNNFEAYEISVQAVQTTQEQLNKLDPKSEEYKTWSGLLIDVIEMRDSLKKKVLTYNNLEMVTIQVALDKSYKISNAKLDDEVAGKILLTSGTKNSEFTEITSPVLGMRFYGARVCGALNKTDKNLEKALDLILEDLLVTQD